MNNNSKRIRSVVSKLYMDKKKEEEEKAKAMGEALPDPVDIYRKESNAAYEDSKKSYPRGASASVLYRVKAVLYGYNGQGGVSKSYKQAKTQIDRMRKNGDIARSKIAREQYMRDEFLPAIEALVDVCGVDELLNSPKAIEELDKFALIDGGNANGYAGSYIRTLYGQGRGAQPGESDFFVRKSLRDIKDLSYAGKIRSAVGVAAKAIRAIDSGEHIASEEDYLLLSKVAARG